MLVWTRSAPSSSLACVLFGERFARAAIACRRAGLRSAPAEGTGFGATPAWLCVSRSGASFGAILADVATPSAGRLHDPLAVILWRTAGPDGHGRVAFTPACGHRRATRRRASGILSAETRRFSHHRSPPRAVIERAKIAASAPIALILAALAVCLILLRPGPALRALCSARSDRPGRDGQSLAPGAIPSWPVLRRHSSRSSSA